MRNPWTKTSLSRASASSRAASVGRLEVEEGAALAVSRIDDEREWVLDVRRGDREDVGTVLGEDTSARGPGEHAREVEHADPFKWSG